jgi:hypothetical protein
MLYLTGSELEFLSSLMTGWRRPYWNEVVRLLKEDEDRSDDLPDAPFAAPQSGPWSGCIPS